MSLTANLAPTSEKTERNWLPLVVAAAAVLLVAAVVFIGMNRGNRGAAVAPITAPLDPYAASLNLSRLKMSESGNLAGGKLTYLDGHIANLGERTVTGITVQVLFRNGAREVAQNETQPLKLIRMREPYIDVGPISAAPIKPGGEADFRLIFDAVSPDWDGAYPEVRILRVEAK